ncbi:hypothetical protein [Sutcliffiella deserti]|uniref:hypothetical protein n=1 Tax=Sutcliffiella deserti TaxID=2875501 RepID=UPI001CBC4822|nr:hypothetical protein [Sutcliffiella deserti]
MESKLRNLRKVMNSTTHKGKHFTELQKNNIRKAILTEKEHKPSRAKGFLAFVMTGVVITLLALFLSSEVEITPHNHGGANQVNEDWAIRNEYRKEGKVLFRILPEPGITAGKHYGYIFSFSEPFEVFERKELAIYAVHKETKERVTVVSPEKITEASSGYPSLERYTATYEVPFSGIWKYEVFLDGEFYGDVVLSVKEMNISLPESIPDFVEKRDFEQIDWKRKAIPFGRNIVGNENKSGVIGMEMPSLTQQKWMWHLWGTEAEELTIVGYHRNTKSVHPILINGWTIGLAGENNVADAHIPSSVTIPKPGEWAFLLYTNDQLFDILVYEIKE